MSAESQGRRDRMLYWICTGLLAAQMLVSAGMYLFNHEMVREAFMHLGYPTHIIYPLAAAKLLGLAAVLRRQVPLSQEPGVRRVFLQPAARRARARRRGRRSGDDIPGRNAGDAGRLVPFRPQAARGQLTQEVSCARRHAGAVRGE